MLDIKLNREYKIKAIDELNYVLYRKGDKSKTPKHKLKEDVEVGYVFVGYYASMEDLAEDLTEREIKLSDAKTFQEVINYLKEIKIALRNKELTRNGL